jgi:hypothetical protein
MTPSAESETSMQLSLADEQTNYDLLIKQHRSLEIDWLSRVRQVDCLPRVAIMPQA